MQWNVTSAACHSLLCIQVINLMAVKQIVEKRLKVKSYTPV